MFTVGGGAQGGVVVKQVLSGEQVGAVGKDGVVFVDAFMVYGW